MTKKKREKTIFLGDIHVSARNDSPIVAEYQIKFFEEQLFPYMISHGITNIIQTGDLLERRKYSNHVIVHEWKRRVFDKMRDMGFKMFSVLGNHDIAHKNTLEVNGPELIFGSYDNINIIKEPTELNFGGDSFLLIPWICQENQTSVRKAVDSSNASYCVGHFEFAGFELQRGHMMTEGDSVDPYKKFVSVISGHYHTKSVNDNVVYLGTPYELTWVDADDPKGFWVFDHTTKDLDFIRNTTTLFNKVVYDDKDCGTDYYKSIPFLHLKDSYVKIYVLSKTDPYGFEKLYERILSIGVADIKIIEDVSSSDVEVDTSIKIEDTMVLVEDFVSKTDTDLDKTKIIALIKELHLAALSSNQE